MVDLAKRIHGIGASEAAMVLGLHPSYGPGDVWLRKAPKGRSPRIAELLEDDSIGMTTDVADSIDDPGKWARKLGHVLEQVALDVYRGETGSSVRSNAVTFSHRRHEVVMATPDGLAVRGDIDDESPPQAVRHTSGGEWIVGGVEAKAVGGHNARAWKLGVPEQFQVQAIQNMAVMGTPWWDVVALIGGTSIVMRRFERDADAEDALVNEIGEWWEAHVVKDIAPESTTPEERRRVLRALYPRGNDTKIRVDDPALLAAVDAFEEARAVEEQAKRAVGKIVNTFLEATGENKGLFGDWGNFVTWNKPGAVSWKAVAEGLRRGGDFDELVAQYTGSPSRGCRLYPAKEKP